MKNLSRKFEINFIGIFFLFNLFLSCTIGLGQSVDIQAPTLTITYPPDSSYVCQDFYLAGSWNDDKSLKEILVEVYKGNDYIETLPASLNKDNTWSLHLNIKDEEAYPATRGWPYSDGEYKFLAIAEDNGGHFSQSAKATFFIDNTPPVLMLTNPTSTGNKNLEQFGQIIQFTGAFYDLCNKISNFQITFYDKNEELILPSDQNGNNLYDDEGNLITYRDYTNIMALGDSSPLTVARYYSSSQQSSDNQKVADVYSNLIGSENLINYEAGLSVEDSQVYFTVTVKDDAKVFQDPFGGNSNGEKRGNESSEIYKATVNMQRLIAGDLIKDFSLAAFAAYLNGTSNQFSAYSEQIDPIAAAAKVSNDTISLSFKFNPQNNPTYTIGGYEIVSQLDESHTIDNYSGQGYKKAYVDNPVPLSINVGNDNKKIQTNTVSIYCIDTDAYTGEISAATFSGEEGKKNFEAGYFTLLHTWDESVYNRFLEWGKDYSSCYTQTDADSSITALTKTLVTPDCTAGHNYLFFVCGKDVSGNEILAYNSKGYGFCGAVATSAAKILIKEGKSLNSIINQEVFNCSASSLDDILYLSGTVASNIALKSFKYTVYVEDDNDPQINQLYTSSTDAISVAIKSYDQAPDYSENLLENYCYNLTSDSSLIYQWRVNTAAAADTFDEIISKGSGTYTVLIILDADNGDTSSTSRSFTLDTNAPVPELNTLTTSKSFTKDSRKMYWVNPKNPLTLTGLVTDNFSSSKACSSWIKIVAADKDGNEIDGSEWSPEDENGNLTILKGVNTLSFEIPANTISSEYYGANIYIYSKDAANNTGISETIALAFDTTGPKARHAEDGNGKDLYFRIGDYDNTDITSEDELWNDSLDKNVGGKYSTNTFGNATTIKVRGYYDDPQSGTKMVYYKLYTEEPDQATINTFFNSYESLSDGMFAPFADGEIEEKRVFYTGLAQNEENEETKGLVGTTTNGNDDEGSQTPVYSEGQINSKYYATIPSNFETTLSGLSVGKNYIAFVAVDYLGNARKDAITVKNAEDSYSTYNNISLNVDTESPILTCNQTGQQFTNGVSEIELDGNCYDLPDDGTIDCAGLKSIKIILNQQTIEAQIFEPENEGDTYTWKATIPTSYLANLSSGKTYNVNALVTDYAGNSNSATLFNLSFDTESPHVVITNPLPSSENEDSIINGKITLSGNVEYSGSDPSKLKLYYSETGPDTSLEDPTKPDLSSLTFIKEINESSKIYSWKFEDLDIYTLSGVTEDKPCKKVYLIPVVYDYAGNWRAEYFEYYVNQNADRPVINISSMDNSESWLTKDTIQGSISDDDGISELYISQDPENWGSKRSVTNGNWTYELSGGDGEGKTLYFKIIDKEGKTFTTGGEKFNRPYYLFAETDTSSIAEEDFGLDNTAPIIVNLDTSIPLVAELGLVNGSDASNLISASTVAASPTDATYKISGNRYIGGEIKYFKLYVPVYEKNPVTIKAQISDSDGNVETSKYNTWSNGNVTAISSDEITLKKVDSVTYTPAESGKSYQYYESEVLTAGSEVVSGLKAITITALDKAGNKTPVTKNVQMDNSGPVIKIFSPATRSELTGKITITGSAIDGISGTKEIFYLIPTKAEREACEALSSEEDKTDYIASLSWKGTLSSSSSATMWSFVFDGSENDSFETYDSSNYALSIENGVYEIPVYFKAVDEVGNYTICTDFIINHNPDGDRPKVEFTYPLVSNYDINATYITLGGTIRPTGTAIIPSGTTTVKNVYLQIAAADSSFTDSDKTTASSSYGFTVVDAYTVINEIRNTSYSSSSSFTAEQLKSLGFASKEELDSWWGISANGSASWNIALNSNEKMNPQGNSTNDIKIRACAVNAEGKMGAWSGGDNVIEIHIDNKAPGIEYSINQYDTEISSSTASTELTAKASLPYTADMYLRGSWYLVLDVLDESGISKLEVKEGNQTLTAGTGYYTCALSTEEKNGYRVFVKITKSSSYSISATDMDTGSTPHTASQTFDFTLDNDAPTLDNIKGNEALLSFTDAYTANSIVNKNYVYTISGDSTDEASGFKNLAFYFIRKSDSKKTFSSGEVILDPMISTSSEDTKVSLEELEKLTIKQNEDEFYLYARKHSGSSDSESFTSDTAYDEHVRVGGLIFIDGIYRQISKISGNKVTFEPSSTSSHSSVDAWFPIAQVIDNTSSEIATDLSTKPVTFKSGDDADTMLESVTKSGSVWSWDASIQSDNLPDGPLALVILAFDNAGNVNGKTIKANVSNNAPRLAKVTFATDLNSNNSFETNECESYDLYGKTAEYQSAYTLNFENFGTSFGSGIFTIKDKLAVIPEVVGGNSSLLLVAKKDAENENAVTSSSGLSVNAATSNLPDFTTSYANSNVYGYILSNSFIAGKDSYTNEDDGNNKAFSFTFWDNTEECTAGLDSQNAVLYVTDFIMDLTDGNKPKTVINPFYWQDLNDNSTYNPSKVKSYEYLKGHIELEADLSQDLISAYGNDPKVSGIITFTGSAYDDHALSSLTFTLSNKDGSAYTSFNNITMAEYNQTNHTWSNTAAWKEANPDSAATIAADGYEVLIVDTGSSNGFYNDDTFMNQNGHKIYWTLSIDTSKIDTTVAENVKLTVLASDSSGLITDLEDTESNKPLYQMDVMPYITNVTTKLSSLKKNNPSIYSRSALGHYPVKSDESIIIEGFNLGTNTSIDVSTVASSGLYNLELAYTEGDEELSLPALNNLNNNDAKGLYSYDEEIPLTGDITAYKNYYNRQPNGDNNNRLTDDIYLEIWQINSEAGKPTSGPLSQPVMAINPANKQVGFAFANGSLRFSMGSLDKSYDFWEYGLDFWTSIGFAYDANGNSFGTAAGGDINKTKADSFGIFTSRWSGKGYTASTNGHNNGTGQLRLELIGQSESTFTDDTVNINKERIKSPSIATTVSSADASDTNVYLAYYDEINDEIRFKWGIISDSNNIVRKGRIYYAGQDSYYNSINDKTSSWEKGLFADYYGPKDSDGSDNATKDTTTKTVSLTGTKVIKDLPYTLEYVSLIAGQTTDKKTFVPGASGTKYTANTAVMTRDNKPVCAGQYVCIAAKYQGGDTYNIGTEEEPVNFTDDLVVAVWYDATNNQMLYSYNTAPQKIKAPTYKGNNYNTVDSYSQSATGWSTPVAVFGEGNGIGEYCKVALDANGKVHIACYDNANADVWYAYIDNYAAPENAKTCIVDSYGIVGTELSLDVAISNGNSVPYISYYGSSCARPKIAFWAADNALSEGSDEDSLYGAEEEVFTGNWEVSIIPSTSKISIDHINVGVWKDSSGNLTWSTTDGNAPGNDNIGSSSAGTSNGMIYGNGTKNPILGYAITKSAGGYIETAQIK